MYAVITEGKENRGTKGMSEERTESTKEDRKKTFNYAARMD